MPLTFAKQVASPSKFLDQLHDCLEKKSFIEDKSKGQK
jgi:hypothetical protein